MAYRETEHTRDKKAHTRQRLLSAARDIVAEQGFAAATALAVAERSGVATGTIYRHFPNKSELVADVFRYATEHEVAQVAAASQQGDSVAQRLSQGIQVFIERALRGPTLAYALIAEPVDPRVEQERLTYRLAYADIFEDLINEGIDTGEFTPQEASISAAAMVGLLSEALVGPLFLQKHSAVATPAANALPRQAIPTDIQALLQHELTALCLRALGVILHSGSSAHDEHCI